MAKQDQVRTPAPQTEVPKKDESKTYGVEPTELPDTSVHKLDRGITPNADAPEPQVQL